MGLMDENYGNGKSFYEILTMSCWYFNQQFQLSHDDKPNKQIKWEKIMIEIFNRALYFKLF